jgi:hypothetical protein
VSLSENVFEYKLTHILYFRKLYAKQARARSPKKRTSAKKKTPGKRKTPKSAKRQVMSSAESSSSRISSKRALFTSPIESNELFKPLVLPKDFTHRARLPRRSLFSPVNDENKKRQRSTSPDSENRVGKVRRLESPTRMPKSQSFSIAPSTSSLNLAESYRKNLIYRTQSEMFSQSSTKPGPSNVVLGYTKPLSADVKAVRHFKLDV